MRENKRYYWVKLMADFFDDIAIKALRTLPSGDSIVLIYQHLFLKSLRNDGMILFEHYAKTFDDELALNLNEDVNLIKLAIEALRSLNLITLDPEKSLTMLAVPMIGVGSETASTIRSRESRANKRALLCNTNETPLQQNTTIMEQSCIIDIDKEKNIEIEIEKDLNKDLEEYKNNEINIAVSVINELMRNKLLDHKEVASHGYLKYLENEIKCHALTYGYISELALNVMSNLDDYNEDDKYDTFIEFISNKIEEDEKNGIL